MTNDSSGHEDENDDKVNIMGSDSEASKSFRLELGEDDKSEDTADGPNVQAMRKKQTLKTQRKAWRTRKDNKSG